MAEFLLEIFSEEIPARMQKRAMEDLAKMVSDALAKNGIVVENPKSWVAPRRIGLCIENLPNQTPEVREEKKGPKLGSPQPAIDGFIRASGISSIDEARIENDPKKGDFYVVDIVKPGSKTTEILANALPQIIQSFPWPKSMRWGVGNLRWVRPIHSIIALFDGALVDFEIEGVKSGNKTEGHRFHGNGVFEVSNYADYQNKVANANVMIDREDRKAEIMRQIGDICAANNLELIEDIGLLEEVCGLVDKPVVILGQMDESFLDLPPEVIRLTLRINQKYFVLNSKTTGKLAPNFIVVSNVAAIDGGKAIAHGNARVLAARLNDARYFWDLDRKTTLESRVEKLDKIVFHQKIGSLGDKVKRIVELAGELAPIVGADVELAKRAALLAKADLVTEMVGEFPELQGVMGRYYANNDGETQDVANAIMEHYKPVGPSDYVPTNPVSIAAALADKFDTLVSFFAIGEKPTGSGDPYALRRAALGIIRIILDNNLRLPLGIRVNGELQSFFLDRLKVYLRDEGYAHDVIDAVFANQDDDLVRIVNRIKALFEFLKTSDGENLLAGFKRATNILKAEEKKGDLGQILVVNPQHLKENAEKALFSALQQNDAILTEKLQKEDFACAMKTLAQCRAPIYDFLDNVLVNDNDQNIRLNRLALLQNLRQQMRQVADFEQIRG
ncbi:MAG: glycine--tRNA ligase subunit beta [Caulobacterales bacterium]|nr:glycine--tRNA ligase subunit beta [Caulobacterales bacterium]MCA0373216.1 glycine--tRNA ligase subunit beta [Pseudomonadota bacterium]